MVNNSTNINKVNNHLSPQIIQKTQQGFVVLERIRYIFIYETAGLCARNVKQINK